MNGSYASHPVMNMPFAGAKLAILIRDAVVTIFRDDTDAIPYPNHWDLPGGGREGQETPVECVVREVYEELNLNLDCPRFQWARRFHGPTEPTWFFVLMADEVLIDAIRLGDEGQCWQLMPLSTFLSHPAAIPRFQDRLRLYLAEVRETKSPPLSS